MAWSASSSKAEDSRITATDSARVAGKSSTITEAGAVTIGQKGKYQEAGSTDFSGSKIGQLGGVNLNADKGANVTYTTSDPGVIQSALDKVSELSGRFGQNISDLVNQSNSNTSNLVSSVNAANSSLLGSVSDKIAALAESKQTDGQSQAIPNIVWVAIASIAGLVALAFAFKKS